MSTELNNYKKQKRSLIKMKMMMTTSMKVPMKIRLLQNLSLTKKFKKHKPKIKF